MYSDLNASFTLNEAATVFNLFKVSPTLFKSLRLISSLNEIFTAIFFPEI